MIQIFVLLSLALWASAFKDILIERSATVPAPIVAASSQLWDGIDGPWSTLSLRVGTPIQNVRVLVSTSGQETWVVIPGGCSSANYPSNCAASRGSEFTINSSTTWQSTTAIWNNTGIYELGDEIGQNLGLTGNGVYGFDTVGLSWQSGTATLNHTVVAGIVAEDYWLGEFGISPRPTNFTVQNDNSSSLTDPQPSFFSLLKANKFIPSLSYSFNAGSYYRSSSVKNAFASLIFGGYDASRSVANDFTFQLATDDGRELVVGIQTITKLAGNSNTSLLPSGILAALDSSQPNIWLPLAACQDFEQVFGLTWNSEVEMYLVNNTLHELLLTEDPSIVFKLGNTVQGGQSMEITLPYGAFDLAAQSPLVNSSTRYFPLKRAANANQYTLGRAFLQEVYLTVDYERHNFSLSQAIWNDTAPANIKTITSPSSSSNESAKSSALSSGAIVGIIIGTLVLLITLALAVFFFIRRKRQSRSKRAVELEGESGRHEAGALSGRETAGVAEEKRYPWAELDGVDGARYEIDTPTPIPAEMEGESGKPIEMGGRTGVHELYGDDLGRNSELARGRMEES